MNALNLHAELPSLQLEEPVLEPAQTREVARALGLLDAAHAKAEELNNGAEAALEAERQKGFQQGMEEAAAEAAKHHLETVQATLGYFEKIEATFADTIISCLRNLIQTLPEQERLLQLTAQALDGMRQQQAITLRVHPDREAFLNHSLRHLVPEGSAMQLRVRPDPNVDPDGCVLESPIGVVNASLENQLALLRQQLQPGS